MDIEWAKDGRTGELFILQARPETVQTRRAAAELKTYEIKSKGRQLVSGVAVGDGVGTGRVCRLENAKSIARFEPGSILVTSITDPDWVPIMKRAAAIVTDHGGRTSHAAIVSRELGLPAIVGTGSATRVLRDGQAVTVSCAEGDAGSVYAGIADVTERSIDIAGIPATRTKVMLNVANPAAAFAWWQLPADGVGLARIEFIVSHDIKIHPLALLNPEAVRARRSGRVSSGSRDGWDKPRGVLRRAARVAASPGSPRRITREPVIVRTSDFKTNEYARLIGGAAFEPREENPMLGWRGASPLLQPRLSRRLCARMPRAEARARGDGLRQRHRDDSVLPHA